MSNFNSNWISHKIEEPTIDYAQDLGIFLVKEKFTRSQFRNFYGELKRIQLSGIERTDNQTSFLLLRPKLAYAAKRANTHGAAVFRKEIEKALNAVDIGSEGYELRFKNFCDLIEAILAFHRAEGGKD